MPPGLQPRWRLPRALPEELPERFPHLSRVVLQVLANRGLTDESALAAFLSPPASGLGDPAGILGMEAAVARLARALADGAPVALYADYDVDGITGAAVLARTFDRLNQPWEALFPVRARDGYGVHRHLLEDLLARGHRLIVTIDCGISAAAEIAWAAGQGADVIVIDHHLPPPTLPPALAIINPRQPGCAYRHKELASVGLAYQVIRGLRARGLVPPDLGRELLELVALGTVADMAPLLDENRLLVRHGLAAMQRTPSPGVVALAAAAGLRADVSAADIGHLLGPRLNAAGRLADARLAFDLLMAKSPEEASDLAGTLDTLNRERQTLTRTAFEEARERAQAAIEREEAVVVVASPTWSPGILGLVAGRLVEEYGRPAVALREEAGVLSGSARGRPGFDLAGALDACTDLLLRHGGHHQAAGLALPAANLAALRACLQARAEKTLTPEDLVPVLEIDAAARLAELTAHTYRDLRALEPCGHRNPPPVLLLRDLRLAGVQAVGQEEKHLRARLMEPGSGATMPAIAFGWGASADELRGEDRVDVVGTLDLNQWNGTSTLQFRVHDLAAAGSRGE